MGANVLDPTFLLDRKYGLLTDRISIAQKFSIWMEHTQSPEKTNSVLKIISDEASFHMGLARLARKTDNFRLANRHIRLYYSKRFPALDGIAFHPLAVSVSVNTSCLSNKVINDILHFDIKNAIFIVYGFSLLQYKFFFAFSIFECLISA